MGQAQGTEMRLLLPKEYDIKLPSETKPVVMRKLTVRDQAMAAKRFDQDKDGHRYGAELARLVTLSPKSVSAEAPAGLPAFGDEEMLDLTVEDMHYLSEAMQALNKMSKKEDEKKYVFNF